MTESEWLHTQAFIESAWPKEPWSDATLELAALVLKSYSKEHVRAAVLALCVDGERFIPLPGVIAHKAAELSQSTTLWGEVWAEIMRSVRTYGDPGFYEVPWSSGELTRYIYDVIGADTWKTLCLCNEGEDLPTIEAQWRNKWQAYRDRARQDVAYQALEGSNLPALQRGRSGALGGPRPLREALPGALAPPGQAATTPRDPSGTSS